MNTTVKNITTEEMSSIAAEELIFPAVDTGQDAITEELTTQTEDTRPDALEEELTVEATDTEQDDTEEPTVDSKLNVGIRLVASS